VVNIINLIPSRPISRLGSFDVFLLEINEFSRKKHCSALRIEILIKVKVYLVKKPVIRYASIKTKSLIENDRTSYRFEYG